MRQARLHGAGDLRLDRVEIDAERLRPDEIYVETLATAFSTGTDLGNYLGDSTYVPGAPGYPRTVGYSHVGRVARVGAAIRRWRVGERIFSTKPHQSAYIATPSDLLVPVPDGVRSDEASLAYLAQLGLAALRQARYEPGERVTIVGLGVVGLCAVAVARLLGAEVTAVANSPIRGAAARHLGADHLLLWPTDVGEEGADPATRADRDANGRRDGDADVVLLTANDWQAYRLALEQARRGGRVSLLGFPGRGQPLPDFNPLDPRWLYAKQLSIIGAGSSPAVECGPDEIRFNLRRNLAYLLDRMADRSLSLAPIVSHRLPAARLHEAYDLARARDKQLLAAVFVWREDDDG